MNDAEYQKAKDFLVAMREKWAPCMGLKWWQVQYLYDREGQDFKATDRGACSETVLMRTYADWRYLNATINTNMPEVVRLLKTSEGKEQVERAWVHEYAHILVNEMRFDVDPDKNIDHEERVCETLARAFMWTREGVNHAAEEGEEPKNHLG